MAQLTGKNLKRLRAVFSHPLPRDLRERELVKLLEAAGATVRPTAHGYIAELGGRTVTWDTPKRKGVDKAAIAGVREMLRAAGITP